MTGTNHETTHSNHGKDAHLSPLIMLGLLLGKAANVKTKDNSEIVKEFKGPKYPQKVVFDYVHFIKM